MNKYPIQIGDITKRNRFLKVFFYFSFPLIGILFYHLQNPRAELDAKLEFMLVLTLTLLPSIILGIKMRDAFANKEVVFGNGVLGQTLLHL